MTLPADRVCTPDTRPIKEIAIPVPASKMNKHEIKGKTDTPKLTLTFLTGNEDSFQEIQQVKHNLSYTVMLYYLLGIN